MSRLQVAVVGLCVLLNMVDGMDIVVLSYSAPVIASEWQLGPERVGWLFSAGLLGMMSGCLFLAPLADRFGRKPVLMLSLLLICLGMSASALAGGYTQLLAARLVNGIGVGGILPMLATIAMEFSSENRRNFSVGLVQAGWPLGAILTGLYAVWAIPHIGWRGLLASVAGVVAVSIPLVWLALPESIEYLEHRQPPGALSRINAILARLGKTGVDSLAAPDKPADKGGWVVRSLLQPEFAASTLRLWAAVFFAFITLYTLMSWVPTFAQTSGMKLERAIYAGAMLNVGALIGSAAIGVVSARTGLRQYVLGSLLTAIVLMVLFGRVASDSTGTLMLILLIGATVQGGFNAFYPIASRVYPVELRAAGIGYAVGVGRAGAVAGPVLAGYFLAAGVTMPTLFAIFSVPLAISALTAFSIPSPALRGPRG
ncbi:MAG: hypothetical protein RLZZ200_2849 [Pseudomonadota bacterium]